MNIRKAEKADIAQLIPLIREFHKETLKPFGMGFDVKSVENTISMYIEHHVGLVVEKDGEIAGCIGGAVAPSFTDYNQRIFIESIWYVKPEYRGLAEGVKLLRMVEDYCRKIGITKICMKAMECSTIERLSSFYRKCGYKPLERDFIKELNNAGS